MQAQIDQALAEISSVVLGKEQQVKLALCCLLAGGHLLLEDLPGMGKTTLAQALAGVLGLSFKRIQFTSDLLPADILGGSVFDPTQGTFSFREGPVFCQLLMADEINRATPRTQSALLEAMEEGQVTLDGETRPLPEPFFVIATQNPTNLAGTYPLPESQTDRFLMCLSLGYPNASAERELLKAFTVRHHQQLANACLSDTDLGGIRKALAGIHVSDVLLDYVQRLIDFTRNNKHCREGLSPRAGMAIMRAASCYALMHGRDYVSADDVQAVFPAVAEHRLQANTDVMTSSYDNNQGGLGSWILASVNVLPAPH
ncbi:MoxR family ATPase [Gammaproteobacteria bacterium LSUCC0112]|nr:MoxR family ATPase [Gammaproteobacteria bacterium LSUCC0112]